MNKQPFYHRAVILSTADKVLDRGKLEKNFRAVFTDENCRTLGIFPDTIEVEECDAEPGDPADLVG